MLAGLAVGIGVPILLFYVYGVVPVSLCRSGGCGVTTNGSGVRFEFDDENELMGALAGRNTGGNVYKYIIFISALAFFAVLCCRALALSAVTLFCCNMRQILPVDFKIGTRRGFLCRY